MVLNEKLQVLRKQRGLTQEELAKALFVSRTAVSKWESGRGCPSIDSLKALADSHPVVDGVELLPFRKICQTKYDAMGIPFPFAALPTPTKEKMEELNGIFGI